MWMVMELIALVSLLWIYDVNYLVGLDCVDYVEDSSCILQI